jgi:hypothetical protein
MLQRNLPSRWQAQLRRPPSLPCGLWPVASQTVRRWRAAPALTRSGDRRSESRRSVSPPPVASTLRFLRETQRRRAPDVSGLFWLYTSCTHILYTYMGLGPYPAWALGGRTCPPMLRAGPGGSDRAGPDSARAKAGPGGPFGHLYSRWNHF